ncbi:MAG: L-2-amino-thiazoline-4-carboxylic acid hydrolase [Promethearchaeati archaeon SRVP18_Atabeyarchaeia-1]
MESPRNSQFAEEYKKWQRSNIENIVSMLRSIGNLYGEGVFKVASAAYSSLMRQRWKQIAEVTNDRSIEGLFRKLWDESRDLISFEVSNRSPDSISLNVKSCFWANEFKRLHAVDIGYELCCMTDFYIVEVFNSEITYRRTKTLMKGDDHCDHQYSMYG